MKRALWELLIFVLLVAAGYGVWTFEERRLDATKTEMGRRCSEELDAMRRQATTRNADQARGEARAVFRAFVAGIHADLVAGRTTAVDAALGEMLRIAPVTFVHVLDPEGRVLASTDRKLSTTGTAGQEAAWALAAEELEERQIGAGPVEIAAPVYGAQDPVACVWMGYDASRPAEGDADTGPDA